MGREVIPMSRSIAAAVLCLTLLAACSDDKAPAGRTGSGASASVSSGADAALARSMARVIADGFQQGANGRISNTQSECLVNEIAAHVRPDTLTGIASTQPDPKSLPKDARASFGAAFDRCLSSDLAKDLKARFGV